ncbi:MAG: adenylate/guanylate cyclase domain-containing protein [Roseiarcus sp.]
MSETRKIAAILAADVVGYSRLAGADEDRILARLRALRSDLIDPTIAVHNGRVVKRTGDGALVEFRSVVDAVRCAIEVQNAMVERNAGLPQERRIDFRIGIHLGDVVEESDGDLMGDGVNIAARLEGIAKPGMICLSEDAYRQVKGRLDLAVTDLGPTSLKNIAEPVRAYSLQVGMPAISKLSPDKKRRERRRYWTVAAVVAGSTASLIVAGGAWYLAGPQRLSSATGNAPAPIGSNAVARIQAGHLSIVVLPFTNLSNDPTQDYFADSITENLTTDLGRVRNSFVIARNTAFTFKGKAVDARTIGSELGVRYILEGSVQREQNRVRVNAQLIDAENGSHLWADRFEEDFTDIFRLQDEIVARLAGELHYELVRAEAGRGQKSKNADAIDLTMRGLVLATTSVWSSDTNLEARNLFESALKIDPNNASALAGISLTYLLEKNYGVPSPEVDYEKSVVGSADRSISLDPENPIPYFVKAFYFQTTSRADQALRMVNDGIALNPNSAVLLATRASVETYLSKFDQAKTDVKQAMRISPRDPRLGMWHNFLSDAELGLGNFDAATIESTKAIDAGYHVWYSELNVAAGNAHIGNLEAARSALAEAVRLNPKLSVKWLTVRKPILQPRFDDLRKAGLPEE